jgi:hypothetical protein
MIEDAHILFCGLFAAGKRSIGRMDQTEQNHCRHGNKYELGKHFSPISGHLAA